VSAEVGPIGDEGERDRKPGRRRDGGRDSVTRPPRTPPPCTTTVIAQHQGLRHRRPRTLADKLTDTYQPARCRDPDTPARSRVGTGPHDGLPRGRRSRPELDDPSVSATDKGTGCSTDYREGRRVRQPAQPLDRRRTRTTVKNSKESCSTADQYNATDPSRTRRRAEPPVGRRPTRSAARRTAWRRSETASSAPEDQAVGRRNHGPGQ